MFLFRSEMKETESSPLEDIRAAQFLVLCRVPVEVSVWKIFKNVYVSFARTSCCMDRHRNV